jgi:hypothetical protein
VEGGFEARHWLREAEKHLNHAGRKGLPGNLGGTVPKKWANVERLPLGLRRVRLLDVAAGMTD